MVGVGDLDIMINGNITGPDCTRSAFSERQHSFILGMHTNSQTLEVEQDIGDILLTPSMVVYSWRTFSISASTTAQPGMDESNTRRNALPSVCPNPRSRGSMVIFAQNSLIGSTSTRRGFNNSLNATVMRHVPPSSFFE